MPKFTENSGENPLDCGWLTEISIEKQVVFNGSAGFFGARNYRNSIAPRRESTSNIDSNVWAVAKNDHNFVRHCSIEEVKKSWYDQLLPTIACKQLLYLLLLHRQYTSYGVRPLAKVWKRCRDYLT